MDTYRLQIAIKGSLRAQQVWTSAKKTQEVLAFNGLRDLKAAAYIALSGFGFVQLHYLTASYTNLPSLAPYVLAHFFLGLRSYRPRPSNPVMRYNPQLETGLFGAFSRPALYRGPWEAYERAQAQTRANEHLKDETQKLTFVCPYSTHQGSLIELEPAPYFQDDIPTLVDPIGKERAQLFLTYHGMVFNRPLDFDERK